jgi:hypothetical protein
MRTFHPARERGLRKRIRKRHVLLKQRRDSRILRIENRFAIDPILR